MNGTVPPQAAPRGAGLRLHAATESYSSYRLQSGAAVTAPSYLRSVPEHHLVRRSDAAVRVMTDFAAGPAFTIGAGCAIDDALDEMFRRGVRALIVLGEDDTVVGLVTSYDIQGERTEQHLRAPATRRREEVKVRDILTACAEWTTIDWQQIQSARIGDVLDTFHRTGALYLIVLEASTEASPGLLRGIISRTRIERQLGEAP